MLRNRQCFSFTVTVNSFLLLSLLSACQPELRKEEPVVSKPLFDSIPVRVTVQLMIAEVSGIADSKVNAGYLWAQEDGGNPSQLYLLKHDGSSEKKIVISGVSNRDWEDMALSGSDIYLGEIGDNNAAYSECAFYKFAEPAAATDTVRSVETIRFRYADGPRDAEAFFVEPSSKAIYIITKRDAPSRIYKLSPPFSTTTVNVATQLGQLSYSGVVSAALSGDGRELIVKTYLSLYYYTIATGETWEAALAKTPLSVPYTIEPQGEAVCFSKSGSGYFTLSEKGLSTSAQQLFFYRRN